MLPEQDFQVLHHTTDVLSVLFFSTQITYVYLDIYE